MKKKLFIIFIVLILLAIASALYEDRQLHHQAASRKSPESDQRQGSRDSGKYSGFSNHFYFPASGRPGNGKED